MKAIFGIALVAMLVLMAGCGKKQAPPPANASTNAPADGTNSADTNTAKETKAEPNYNSGNPITAPVDYLGAVGQAQQRAVKQIDIAYVTHAIQQFNAEEGRNPKDLDELVTTHYLTKLPAAPFGMKLQYDATTGKISTVKK